MKLTVAICTWNRARFLDKTLAAMHQLRIPTGTEWKLLIVNNNCTDNTKEVITKHTGYLPIFEIIETTPGVSNARNAAIKAASGDYIIWTDDDVLVDDGWIEGYKRAFENWRDAAIFAGPIIPRFEGKPPKWLEESWRIVCNAYAICDFGPFPTPLTETTLPYGANLALRLSAQKKYHYNPELGRKGTGMVGYEETTLIRKMLQDGFSGVWVPEARVKHMISRNRQNVNYLRRYFHGQGLYLAKENKGGDVSRFFGYPRWLIKRVFQCEITYQIHRHFYKPEVWIEDLIQASIHWGFLQGSYRKMWKS